MESGKCDDSQESGGVKQLMKNRKRMPPMTVAAHRSPMLTLLVTVFFSTDVSELRRDTSSPVLRCGAAEWSGEALGQMGDRAEGGRVTRACMWEPAVGTHRVASKKPTSCCMMAWNSLRCMRATTRSPAMANRYLHGRRTPHIRPAQHTAVRRTSRVPRHTETAPTTSARA